MGAVIDTSWLIALERAKVSVGFVREMFSEGAAISAITFAELRLGVELADEPRRADRERFVEAVIDALPLLPFGEAESRIFARTWASLRRTGNRIGERDLMIAATAIANGFPVVTLNRSEFERVPGLVLLDATLPGAPPPPPKAP